MRQVAAAAETGETSVRLATNVSFRSVHSLAALCVYLFMLLFFFLQFGNLERTDDASLRHFIYLFSRKAKIARYAHFGVFRFDQTVSMYFWTEKLFRILRFMIAKVVMIQCISLVPSGGFDEHIHTEHSSKLPCETRPSTTVVIVCPFFVIFVVLVRSAERERLVRVLDGDADRCDERDDGRGNEFRPSFILNLTLNIFLSDFSFSLF